MNVQPSRFFEGTPRKTVIPASPARKTNELMGFAGKDLVEKSPKRTNNHQKSDIFNGKDANDNKVRSVTASPARSVDTKSRLFGGKVVMDPTKSPRRLNTSSTFSSSVFADGDKPQASPKHTPKKMISQSDRNPITGITKSPSVGPELLNGHCNGITNGHAKTNGHDSTLTNGITNGHTNGH